MRSILLEDEFNPFMKFKEKLNLSLVQFISVAAVLLINFGFFPMSGGEEQYMGFTAQWANPEWIKNSFSFSEFPGTRLIFQFITAPLISMLGIEGATYFLRILTLILISWPLSQLFKSVKLSLLGGVLALQIFISSGQNLFGGEWIVNTFEPKALAYLFGLCALLFHVKGKIILTALLLALSTYFHFLIGGWLLVVLGIHLLLSKEWKASFKGIFIYLTILAPFIMYLYNGYFGTELLSTSKVDPDWVYCYYRLPHHTGIFKSYEFFVSDSLLGVLFTAGALITSAIYRKTAEPLEKKYVAILMIAFSLNLLFVIAAWVDGILLEQKASFLIKYYPFRTNSIAFLLFLILGVKWLAAKIKMSSFKIKWNYIAGVALVLLLVIRTNNEWKFTKLDVDSDFDSAARAFTELTDEKAIVVSVGIPLYNGRLNRFSRLAERDLLATYKFTPAEPEKIIEWYERIKVVASIQIDPLVEFKKYKDQYKITHIISSKELSDLNVSEIFSNDTYKIYQVND